MNDTEFQVYIWQKGHELFRAMPWRSDTSPYVVLVSEIMLQQTQVERVIPKFNDFIARFPTIEALARARLDTVLTFWNGLGYNRRAKFLHEAAKKVVAEFGGAIPRNTHDLLTLSGVGHGTAGAVMAYSYNQPVVFIETNIRRVYFHHFFDRQETVTDTQLYEMVEATLDKANPREWYWALMDYGTFLKRQGIGKLAKSSHYKRQPPLKGSIREVRGQIVKSLLARGLSESDLKVAVSADDRFPLALKGLEADGLIVRNNSHFHLTK